MSFKFFSQAETDKDIYEELLPQVEELLDIHEHWVTNLSNLSALLKQAFEKISWVGFYLYDGEKLILGPFQGKIACTLIPIGKGVCGTAAQERKTIVVPNVHEFPGHIACDDASNSEIVIPIVKDEELIGVLDLDSRQLSAFNETDKQYLEKICQTLCDKLPANFSL